MPRIVPKLICGLAALALFASVADAETVKVYKKRRGFFETLFGARTDYQPRPIVSNDGKIIRLKKYDVATPRRPAFDVFGNRIEYKGKKKYSAKKDVDIVNGYDQRKTKLKAKIIPAVVREYAEPEPLPGLGMGTIAYQPPLVVAVFDSAFSKLQTESTETEAVRLSLADSATNIRAVDAERKAVLSLYSSNGFKPLWFKDGHITERASQALKILSRAGEEGLVPANYLPPVLSDFENADSQLAGDILKLAQFEVGLSARVLKYARHLSGGQFDPARLSLYNDIKTSPVDASSALKVIAHTPFLESYLAGLGPIHPQYAMFKKALNELATPSQPAAQLAEGPRVKLGKTDPRIPSIRAKLQLLGHLTAEDAANNNEQLLDKPLSEALKKFQLVNKVKATGSVDAATIQAFNTDRSENNRQRMIYSMERLRWLPKNLGARHVFVNVAAFEVNVMESGKSIWQSRVIVGRPMTQTNSFYDTMETVVFNPTWGVPASIIVNEYGPKSRKDPSYLDRQGFKLVDSKGKPISSRNVDWWGMGQSPTFGVQQPSGDGNALGEIKFLFPNTHSIYMHDTPSRDLFNESLRAFSHGCVRVQNPREFAEVLLGWDANKVVENIASGDSHSVSLTQKTPVYLTYFTAWPNAEGKIVYYDDFYGRDASMAKAFAYNPSAKPRVFNDKIVENGTIAGGLNQN